MDEDVQAPERERAAQRARMRARITAEMAEIGIDEGFIDRMVETFYARVRAHPVLGPVFEQKVSGRWPEHLHTLKRFWQAVALRNGAYTGQPVTVHRHIDGIDAAMFSDWLALFGETLDDIAPSAQARDVLMAAAERIARSLMTAIAAEPDGG